jgi:hypothetical protein
MDRATIHVQVPVSKYELVNETLAGLGWEPQPLDEGDDPNLLSFFRDLPDRDAAQDAISEAVAELPPGTNLAQGSSFIPPMP